MKCKFREVRLQSAYFIYMLMFGKMAAILEDSIMKRILLLAVIPVSFHASVGAMLAY